MQEVKEVQEKMFKEDFLSKDISELVKWQKIRSEGFSKS